MMEGLRGIISRGIAGIAIAATLASVAAAQQAAAPGQTVTVNAPITDPGYKLGVSDRLRLTVFNEPALSGEFAISPGGDVSLPLIGNVPAMGRSVAELQAEVQRRLSDGYLRDPKVAIDIVTFRPFYILGEVGKPGEYPYSDGLTVMNAVATAQGFTYRANKKYVFIKHRDENDERRVPIAADLKVMPGDTIRIGERYF